VVTSRGAVVLGSDYRGLAVVRSLGRRGVPVCVVSGGDDVLAAKSRYAMHRVELQGADDDEQSDFLVGLAERLGLTGWVLFPTADESAALVARRHQQLSEQFALTSPPWRILRWAHDKRYTYERAEALGLPYPRTWRVRSAADAARLELEFPVIVKPAVREEFNRLTAAKAWRVDDRAALRDRLAAATELLDPEFVLLQEIIPGDEHLSYAALCERGRPLATVVARRTRQYPPDFGRASTFVETVDDPGVAALGERFLASVEFDGLAEVEFKRDPRDDSLKLLDVNPRVWGWHGLCQGAGVDFPFLAYRLARGESVPNVRSVAGVRWVRLSTDLPTSLKQIARGNLSLFPYLRTLIGPHESAVFARDDPWPGLVELPMLAGTFVRRLRNGHGV
jgi:predicted ATP-grasp superfamily ATP-dependent carboligase